MDKRILYLHKFFVLILIVVFSVSLPVEIVRAAQIPPQIFTYQGRLTDSGGNLLGGSGTSYYFKFSIWNNATVGSGTRLWPSTVPATTTATVRQGVFTVNIGDITNGYPDSLNLDFSNNSSVSLSSLTLTGISAPFIFVLQNCITIERRESMATQHFKKLFQEWLDFNRLKVEG